MLEPFKFYIFKHFSLVFFIHYSLIMFCPSLNSSMILPTSLGTHLTENLLAWVWRTDFSVTWGHLITYRHFRNIFVFPLWRFILTHCPVPAKSHYMLHLCGFYSTSYLICVRCGKICSSVILSFHLILCTQKSHK